jgi:hypothetical protein
MRVCAIGNSHLAALKKAWDDGAGARYPTITLTFFGSHRDTLKRVHAQGDALTTHDERVRESFVMTSGLATPEIRLADFDLVFLHSLVSRNWTQPFSVQLARHRERTGAVVTRGLLRAHMTERLRESVFFHLLREIRTASRIPVFVSPQAFRSEDDTHREAWGLSDSNPDVEVLEIALELCGAYERMIQDETRGLSARYLAQPAETIVGRFFTGRQYCEGSVRLRGKLNIRHADDDFVHMNAAYGELVLKALERTALEATTP